MRRRAFGSAVIRQAFSFAFPPDAPDKSILSIKKSNFYHFTNVGTWGTLPAFH
jgi:hypothetical protein